MPNDYQSDKELADKLDAQDRLIARGYERKTCDRCGGTGQSAPEICCWQCSGHGYYWQAPLTK